MLELEQKNVVLAGPGPKPAAIGSPASRSSAKPTLTITLVVINVLVFLVMTLAGGSSKPVVLVLGGALTWPGFQGGDYAAALTCAFIHIGFIHLLVNMTALWTMGKLLEGFLGTVRFALIYFTSAVSGSLLSICCLHQVISAGASSAVFGIAGAMLVVGLRHKDQIPPHLRKVFGKGAVPFFILNLVLSLVIPGINLIAHLGGTVGGVACACAMEPHRDRKWARRLVTVGSVLVTVFAFCYHFVALAEMSLKMR